VADAGADAVVIAMIESADQAAAAVAATRYPPAGIRSFGPLRAGLGHDTAALESRVSVFAMIETAAALSGLSQICAVDGLTGLYVGPADLAISMGVDVVGATKHPAVLDAIGRINRAAADAGLIAGIHAGDGKTGRTMAQLGFRMITLASEARALRRGAAEHLREATND
jgi:2-keto-3-deoxy-L-rhamnonate aldolase RhmA